ncbi:hypothetical protein TNCV_4894591 [Trichonephila clavipes]|nr:hypothetical protein TNCV_4894591 [Trichonephila clavipes]
MWEKTSKGLLKNPDRLLKNTNKRMIYIYAASTYPVHEPVEKRPLEEKSLPFSKRRSKVRPVMRRVSRRPELPMAPVPQPPVQIPVSQVPQPPVQILPVQIPHVPETMEIPDVPEPPVQIPESQDP